MQQWLPKHAGFAGQMGWSFTRAIGFRRAWIGGDAQIAFDGLARRVY
jgi:hypothetical protein